MIGDPVRTGAYVRALRRMVTPDSVVLDLGAGFGFFAVLAARLGARHVYAIEPDEAICLGPALARANGVADRVTFYHGDARQVEIPERANVLIEDLRGVLPLHAERVKVLRDARERLLTGDARYVALRDHIFAAPARYPEPVQRDFDIVGADTCGVDLRPVRPRIVDASRRIKSRIANLLLPGVQLGTIDLRTVSDPGFEGTARWVPDSPVVVAGLFVWFDAELSEGEHFSAAPGPEQTVHGSLYLPLREPLAVPAHAELSLRLCGIQMGGDYAWTWECAVAEAGGGAVMRTARQSTLGAVAVTKARLASMSELHRPSLGAEGRRLQALIALTDGVHSSGQIVTILAASADLAFSDESEAFDWLQRSLQLLETGAAEEL